MALTLDPDLLTQVGGDDLYDDPPRERPLPRLQLFHSGRFVDRGEIDSGHYGSPDLGEGVTDLGSAIHVLLLARRPMAMDFNGPEVVSAFDPQSSEFLKIAKRAHQQNGRCLVGPSFLVFERSTKTFFDFYYGTLVARLAARRFGGFLPLTEADIDFRRLANVKPHGPTPATLASKVVNREFSWRVPIIQKCEKHFGSLPRPAILNQAIRQFVSASSNTSTATSAPSSNTQSS